LEDYGDGANVTIEAPEVTIEPMTFDDAVAMAHQQVASQMAGVRLAPGGIEPTV
jgi:hypothetical protein